MTSANPTTEPPAQRLQSLDTYRGLIMVLLAFDGFGLEAVADRHLAANPGSGFWQLIHANFDHVEWAGCGVWDLIQPSFMFMVGVAMAYSYVGRRRRGESYGRMFAHALRRSLILILLGIMLASNRGTSTNWSLVNVLTQIGLGYPFLFLLWGRSFRIHVAAAVVLLAGTWALYATYPAHGIDLTTGAPGVGVSAEWARTHLAGIAPVWQKNANVGHAFDLSLLNIFPRNVPFRFNAGGYQTLNFLPSLATMLFGLMCGELLRSNRPAQRKFAMLLAAAAAGFATGLAWSAVGVPIVKRIWTPSWTLFSAGWCCLILAVLYGLVDLRGWRRWTYPLVVVGMNSIAIYLISFLLTPWTVKTLQTHLGTRFFNLLGAANAPFLHATLAGVVFWLVCAWMYRRKIFVRI